MHYTTFEQSQKLIELGLDPKTADAWRYQTAYGEVVVDEFSGHGEIKWYDDKTHEHVELCRILPENEVAIVKGKEAPAWSLEALLEAIPQSISKYDEREHCRKNYELNLFRSYYHCCSYSFGPSLSEDNHDQICGDAGDTWLEAVYKVTVRLGEKGWLKCKREKGNWIMV